MINSELKGLSLTIPSQRKAKNYYKWIYSVIRSYTGKHILEIGPGHGNMAELLIDDCDSYAASDIDAGVITFLKDKFAIESKAYFGIGSVSDNSWSHYLSAHAVDTILSLNVLEHIEDPDSFIKQITFHNNSNI